MAIELTKELLLSVRKPARYIGGEVNSIKKDLSKMSLKVCLCFPDIYEIGMSHLGLRILYDLINKQEDYCAERVFSPWVDMEEKMRSEHIPLWTLESREPVKDFDILGFSLQYELSYTNVLNILSLSDIPLKSSERDENSPLVIAGGILCLNPEPMAEFIDCFVIGEAEEVIIELMDVVRDHKKSGHGGHGDRQALLKSLSRIKGVYVPSLKRNDSDFKISKRIVKDLDKVLDLDRWVVPYIEIVHDRVGIEIMRGCPNHCSFCQARASFFPLRVLDAEKILEVVRKLYSRTGYEAVSLLSLSSSDHPRLTEMVKALTEEFKEKGVSISLPSLRAKNLVGELSGILADMRKTSLTFAPEAGSERLRKLIHKNIDIEELIEVSRKAFSSGYRLLKLYFMIGLPTETNEDLDQIRDLCVKLSQMRKEIDHHPAQLNVTISNFIPKPHTPFECERAASYEELLAKQDYLKGIFRGYRGFIHLKFHDARMSFIEALFARGDRRLSGVILNAFQKGAKFDAWYELFNFSIWQEALMDDHIDPLVYLSSKNHSDRRAWDFIFIDPMRDLC
ncbi:MAG: TIGR03960 family B12-binding radical SAM protein [Candidatus Omnitrophota bacterium]